MYANFDGMLHGPSIRYKVYRCIYGFSILPLMCWYGCRIFVMPAMLIWWTLKVWLSSDRVSCSIMHDHAVSCMIMQYHAVSCSDEMFARDFVCASECVLVCPSVHLSICQSVSPSVRQSVSPSVRVLCKVHHHVHVSMSACVCVCLC
jgi:hypothetical protein